MHRRISLSQNPSPANGMSPNESRVYFQPDPIEKQSIMNLTVSKPARKCRPLLSMSQITVKPASLDLLLANPYSPTKAKSPKTTQHIKITEKFFPATPAVNEAGSKVLSLKMRKRNVSEGLCKIYREISQTTIKPLVIAGTLEDLALKKTSSQEQKPKSLIKKKSHMSEEASSEVFHLKKNLTRILDNTKEKAEIEKQRTTHVKHRELQQISQELKDLRKLAQDMNPIQVFSNSESPKSPGIIPRKPSSLSPTPRNSFMSNLYFMNSDYKQPTRSPTRSPTHSVNTSISRANITGGFGGYLQAQQEQQVTVEPNGTLENLEDKSLTRSKFSDHFDEIVMFQEKKMPFSLALTAKTRQTLFEEMKQRKKEETENSNLLMVSELRDKLVPEEKAKYLENLDAAEKLKRYKELKSKSAYSTAIYQMLAMSKTSQKKIKALFEEKFAPNSRFLASYTNK